MASNNSLKLLLMKTCISVLMIQLSGCVRHLLNKQHCGPISVKMPGCTWLLCNGAVVNGDRIHAHVYRRPHGIVMFTKRL
jgi:hypothetical protein